MALPPQAAASSELVAALRKTLADELAGYPHSAVMISAYGGSHRCFERFLIARQKDVVEAAVMFRETLAWRAKHGLDDGTFHIDESLRERVKAMWPGQYAPSTTPCGSPMQLFRPGNADPRGMLAAFTEAEFETFYIWWMEESLMLQNKANASSIDVPDSPWSGMLEVYDMAGLSLTQLYPPALAMLARVLSIGQAHYPENLRKLYLLNSPYTFTGAWMVVSAVLSANTLAKITMTSYDGGDELRDAVGGPEKLVEFMAIVDPPSRGWFTT